MPLIEGLPEKSGNLDSQGCEFLAFKAINYVSQSKGVNI